MPDKISSSDYSVFLASVKSEIQSARIKAARVVNRELIALYWKIGEMIVCKQEELGWGKSVVEKLSEDICREFDGIKGFSPQNLWYMRQFYLEYYKAANLQQLVGEIPWGHNILIFNKIKNSKEREYYIKASLRNGWSRNVLLHQIKGKAYERQGSLTKSNNFENTLPACLAEQADETLKDGYMLDFLGITHPVLERELENRMIEKIRDVLIEFGRGFAFMGSQYKIEANEKEYYIDLLFYHRKLKSLVAVELKAGGYKPEYAGKMNFYLNLLDDFVREKDENPSIGIILCSEKDNFEVEYSIRNIKKPMGISEYFLSNELPDRFKKELPSPELLREKLNEKPEGK
jgi:predicted nuclease of restriction endonuclease-like (RecB) superfamily